MDTILQRGSSQLPVSLSMQEIVSQQKSLPLSQKQRHKWRISLTRPRNSCPVLIYIVLSPTLS